MSDPFFDYPLPEHLIAQRPADRRDESRLLVVRRGPGTIEHRTFRDLPDLLSPGDRLVLNDTRVLPARVVGRRETTGGKWQGLFLSRTADGLWEMLAQTRSYPEVGAAFITDTSLRLVLRGRTDDRHWLMEPQETGSPPDLLSRYGHIPLPPYIRKGREEEADRIRYQTVYAATAGSVAAPTAGLHFTPGLEAVLRERSIGFHWLTLHVGAGTFLPVKVDDTAGHRMHSEWGTISAETADALNVARANGGRIVAIGTTSMRLLESAAGEDNKIKPFTGETAIFITPGYRFKCIDLLMTNFHLPKSTLFMLVSAFSGRKRMLDAYAHAIRSGYRFYSYGDACLLHRADEP